MFTLLTRVFGVHYLFAHRVMYLSRYNNTCRFEMFHYDRSINMRDGEGRQQEISIINNTLYVSKECHAYSV